MTSPQWICDTQGWGVFRCDQEVQGREVSVGGETWWGGGSVGGEAVREEVSVGGKAVGEGTAQRNC